MIDEPKSNSTRPYLIRALYEWCTDNGFTPHIAVAVNPSVQVPREYVKDGQIVLNLSFDATSALQLGNDFIEFKARFAGTAREIMVPVDQVIAIYARENGQGMAFPLAPSRGTGAVVMSSKNPGSVRASADAEGSEAKVVQLVSVDSKRSKKETNDEPNPPRPSTSAPRPKLKRVK